MLSGADSAKRLIALTSPIETALTALQNVVRVDNADVEAEEARITRWSRTANWIGWAVGAVVVLGTAITLIINYKVVFRPLFDLSEAMRRFAAGRRDSRARPSTAIEIATAADNFNAMANLITQQHSRMLDFIGSAAHEVMAPVGLIRAALEDLDAAKTSSHAGEGTGARSRPHTASSTTWSGASGATSTRARSSGKARSAARSAGRP